MHGTLSGASSLPTDDPQHPSTAEGDRLAALHSYDLLDSQPEEELERIVDLARRLFDVPIVLITLVDEHRQFF